MDWAQAKFNIKYRIPMIAVALSVSFSFSEWRAGEFDGLQELAFVTAIAFMVVSSGMMGFMVFKMAGAGKVTKIKTITNRKTITDYAYEPEYEEEVPAGDTWTDYDTKDGIVSYKEELPEMSDEQYKEHYNLNPPASVSECKRLIKIQKKKGNGKAVGKLLNIKVALEGANAAEKKWKIKRDGGERRPPMDNSLSPTAALTS